MNRPWMPLYIADYLRDTSHLRAIESGAYLHLIMSYWIMGKLPSDDRQLATIAKLSDREWRACKPTLAAFFGPDFSSHKRIDAEIAKAAELSSKRRASAMQRHSKTDAIAHTLHTTQSPSKQEESKKEARASRGAPLPEDWHPSDEDFSYVENLGFSKIQALDGLEELRLWAGANSNRSVGRKANWSLTYRSWMRRNRNRGTNGKTAGNGLSQALEMLGDNIRKTDRGEEGGQAIAGLLPDGRRERP